jgi:dienelactone hydrolase
MFLRTLVLSLVYVLLTAFPLISHAGGDTACHADPRPIISFIEFPSVDLTKTPPAPLTVKGKLKQPVEWNFRKRCFVAKEHVPAVLILHGSAGIDSRGDFYARALNTLGIATLEIDMWEARGVTGVDNRPPLPLYTYPDAFGALAFMSAQPGIDPARIGVLGFSWGAIVTMATATEGVATKFGGTLRFKAHAAHYPVCYVYNNPYIPGSNFGALAGNPLTGAPILVEIGTKDDYDEGAGPCLALKGSLVPSEQALMDVVVYEGATHAWDRLQVPTQEFDPFAHLGTGGYVQVVPSVDQAYEAQMRVVRFFQKQL